MTELYIEYYDQDLENNFQVSLNSLIILFVYNYERQRQNIKLSLFKVKTDMELVTYKVNLKQLDYKLIENFDLVPSIVRGCQLPCIYLRDNFIVISGLCSVARQIVKSAGDYNNFEIFEKNFENVDSIKFLNNCKNVRFENLENSFENLEINFESVEKNYENLEGNFDNLEKNFDNCEVKKFDNLTSNFENLEQNFEKLANFEQDFEDLDKNLEKFDNSKLIKTSKNKQLFNLLGFKNTCLIACNQVSIWTKFCEIDMPRTIDKFFKNSSLNKLKNPQHVIQKLKNVEVDHSIQNEIENELINKNNLNSSKENLKETNVENFLEKKIENLLIEKNNDREKDEMNIIELECPNDLIRFNNHLSQPVKIHNQFKLINLKQNKANKKLSKIAEKSKIVETVKKLEHRFAEGPFLTLADLILYPQIYLLFKKLKLTSTVLPKLNLLIEWFYNLNQIKTISLAKSIFLIEETNLEPNFEFNFQNGCEQMKVESLYKCDLSRYKPKSRQFTKQKDIDLILNKLSLLNDYHSYDVNNFGFEIKFNWEDVPKEANPIKGGGGLPESRSKRKAEQLENLVKAVLKLAKDGDRIVDFCSGSGHLGILLSILLPKCEIILLENKEESIHRAMDRIIQLNLKNCKLVQSNLEYFNTSFQIGCSLHACGVATDLVMDKCLEWKAAFVCCPCCYGSIHPQSNNRRVYPRSKLFQQHQITLNDYLVLGHSADQTHDENNAKTEQGKRSMYFIDLDRIQYAKQFDYNCHLMRLMPPTCTPKNHLLVGYL